MRLRQLFLTSLLVCVAAVTARADGVPDGQIIVGRGSDPGKSHVCGTELTLISGGGIFNCANTTGTDWIGLDIFIAIPTNTSPNCISEVFTCKVIPGNFFGPGPAGSKPFEHIEIMLFGSIPTGTLDPLTQTCTPLASCFFLNLNDKGSETVDGGGWVDNNNGTKNGQFRVFAITAPAPEPGTILLLAAGLGIMSARRKERTSH